MLNARGNSSVGRAQPCQGWGRGFESRFPLSIKKKGERRKSAPFSFWLHTETVISQCRGGEIGRREGLKIPWGQPHPGSIPGPGIFCWSKELRGSWCGFPQAASGGCRESVRESTPPQPARRLKTGTSTSSL